MNRSEKHVSNECIADSKKENEELKKEACSLLRLNNECKDPEKRKIIEELLDERMDMLLAKFNDFFMLRLQTFIECLAEFSKITSDYKNDYVQAVITLMYKDYCDLIESKKMEELYINKACMVIMTILPIEQGASILKEQGEVYGKQAYDFIFQALSHFSGYEPENEIWKKIMLSSMPVNHKALS